MLQLCFRISVPDTHTWNVQDSSMGSIFLGYIIHTTCLGLGHFDWSGSHTLGLALFTGRLGSATHKSNQTETCPALPLAYTVIRYLVGIRLRWAQPRTAPESIPTLFPTTPYARCLLKYWPGKLSQKKKEVLGSIDWTWYILVAFFNWARVPRLKMLVDTWNKACRIYANKEGWRIDGTRHLWLLYALIPVYGSWLHGITTGKPPIATARLIDVPVLVVSLGWRFSCFPCHTGWFRLNAQNCVPD